MFLSRVTLILVIKAQLHLYCSSSFLSLPPSLPPPSSSPSSPSHSFTPSPSPILPHPFLISLSPLPLPLSLSPSLFISLSASWSCSPLSLTLPHPLSPLISPPLILPSPSPPPPLPLPSPSICIIQMSKIKLSANFQLSFRPTFSCLLPPSSIQKPIWPSQRRTAMCSCWRGWFKTKELGIMVCQSIVTSNQCNVTSLSQSLFLLFSSTDECVSAWFNYHARLCQPCHSESIIRHITISVNEQWSVPDIAGRHVR